MSELVVAQADKISAILAEGDLSRFSAKERNEYYVRLCTETGLNPMLQPFRYLKLSGQLRLYANKSCAEQLRNIHGISIRIVDQREDGGLWIVTVEATDKRGRSDSDVGFAKIKGLTGENRGNAILKAVTKAKRRVTLSMTGLGGLMDETEVASVAEVSGQRFSPGDGEGYTEDVVATVLEESSEHHTDDAAELINQLMQMRTLSAMSAWAYDAGPRITALPVDYQREVAKSLLRHVHEWGVGKEEVRMWVRQATWEEWKSHGQLHAAPEQVNGVPSALDLMGVSDGV